MAGEKKKLRSFPGLALANFEESGQKEGALGPTLYYMHYIQVSSATLNTLNTRNRVYSH